MALIDQQDQLQSIVDRARNQDVVALDTEFVWERTYYPRLGVVQLGWSRDDVFLLDAVALDLAPLGDLLADPGVVKVLHDAVQDLTILRRATGAAPKNVFDTQLAAGFIGLTASLSLQNLLAEIVGVQVSKGAQRSDWLQRPLSREQSDYAADDVRYMVDVYREISARLARLGRTDWVQEEMRALDDPDRFVEDDPQVRYQSVRGTGRKGLGARDYAVLRELTAWREITAREVDKPRGHVLDDSVLVELAQRKPTTNEKLRSIRSMPERVAHRHGEALLNAIRTALESPPDTWPQRDRRQPDDSGLAPRLDLVQAFIRGRGEREQVDPLLVANRADVERLVAAGPRSPESHPILTGWRREFIGRDLEALLAGRAAISLNGDGLPGLVWLDEGGGRDE